MKKEVIAPATHLALDYVAQVEIFREKVEKINALCTAKASLLEVEAAVTEAKEQEKILDTVAHAAAVEAIRLGAGGSAADVKRAVIKARMYKTHTLDMCEEKYCMDTIYKKLDLLKAWSSLGYESPKHSIVMLRMLLTLAAADLTSPAARKEIAKTYALSRLAEEHLKAEREGGVDPLSTRQTEKCLQRTIDSIIADTYRVTKKQWSTLLLQCTRGTSKQKGSSIAIVSEKQVTQFVFDLLYSLECSQSTIIEYKKSAAERDISPVKKPKTAKKSEKTAPVDSETAEKESA